jgi:hypothetical protein
LPVLKLRWASRVRSIARARCRDVDETATSTPVLIPRCELGTLINVEGWRLSSPPLPAPHRMDEDDGSGTERRAMTSVHVGEAPIQGRDAVPAAAAFMRPSLAASSRVDEEAPLEAPLRWSDEIAKTPLPSVVVVPRRVLDDAPPYRATPRARRS